MDKFDRCDRCGAQAFVEVTLEAGVLMFCGHHFAKHEDALVLSGAKLTVDERHLINLKPSVSANV